MATVSEERAKISDVPSSVPKSEGKHSLLARVKVRRDTNDRWDMLELRDAQFYNDDQTGWGPWVIED